MASRSKRTAEHAIAFVRERGAVLVSARGELPSLAEWIVGEEIRGSWWAHPRGQEIFVLLCAVSGSPDVLVCRLIDGKRTLVHRRLWPALLRAAAQFPGERVSRVIEEHTEKGSHATVEVPCPDWAPETERALSRALALEEALAELCAAGIVPPQVKIKIKRARSARSARPARAATKRR